MVPDELKACAAPQDCVMTIEGGCCSGLGAVNKSAQAGWERRFDADVGVKCRDEVCPAVQDEAQWTEVPDCLAGRCGLRAVASAADCERTRDPALCRSVLRHP